MGPLPTPPQEWVPRLQLPRSCLQVGYFRPRQVPATQYQAQRGCLHASSSYTEGCRRWKQRREKSRLTCIFCSHPGTATCHRGVTLSKHPVRLRCAEPAQMMPCKGMQHGVTCMRTRGCSPSNSQQLTCHMRSQGVLMSHRDARTSPIVQPILSPRSIHVFSCSNYILSSTCNDHSAPAM